MNFMFKEIGTFRLGGDQWTVVLDEFSKKDTYKYSFDVYKKEVTLVKGNFQFEYPAHILSIHFWSSVISNLIQIGLQVGEDYNKKEFLIPYSSLITQALTTLTSVPGHWEGTFQVAGKQYKVIPDDVFCEEECCTGMCVSDYGIVYLSVLDKSDEYIQQVLIHEVLHAVAIEMGLASDNMNSELYVNVLSMFINEVRNSLKLNLHDTD